jgi:uncharacterized protein DUF6968
MARRTRRPKATTRTSLPKVRGVVMGKVIAARRLESATDPDLVVTVQVGAPRKTRGQDDYFCPYRVTGIGDDESRAAYGVDAFQALQLVMQAIGSALARRPDLRWYGEAELGFPRPVDVLATRARRSRLTRAPRPPR